MCALAAPFHGWAPWGSTQHLLANSAWRSPLRSRETGFPFQRRQSSLVSGERCSAGAAAAATAAAFMRSSARRSTSMAAGQVAVSDEIMVGQMDQVAKQFDKLRDDWEAIPAGGGPQVESLVRSILAREESVRSALQTLPYGDPSQTTTVQRHPCSDPVVCAHSNVTRAVIEADLARVDWEVRCAVELRKMGKDTSLATSLINSAILRLRLFDIDGAYDDLQESSKVGSSDPRLGLLTRYTAQLKAPREPHFLEADLGPGSPAEALLKEMRNIFLRNSYHTDVVLKATKASSMSEFIFESRAEKLESGLLESVEEPNPMKPEVETMKLPTDLVDLIRIFLLHRVLPLARVCQLFGPDCCQLLLRLGVITALEGESCRLVPAEQAVAAVAQSSFSCGAYYVTSNVAIWPLEEDLLLATDYEQTFSSEDLEPVMYLSEDSLALVCGAPRDKVNTVLDACCGSGVQGLVALRYYAERATFVDINPRAVRFVPFNLAMNGVASKADGIHLGNLYSALPPGSGSFDAMVANPPFVPNPKGIASGAGALFGNGGDTGESVLAAIVQGAPAMIRPGGRLSIVTMAPNVEELPVRMEEWYRQGARGSACEGLVFRGSPTPAGRYLPTSSPAETTRYQGALQAMGVQTLSEVVAVLVVGLQDPNGPNVALAGEPRNDLWGDQMYLRLVVQKSVSTEPLPQGQAPAPVAASVRPVAPPATPAPDPAQPEPSPEEGKPAREGNLPGFQPGFFPAYCQGPSPAWAAIGEELEEFALARR